MYTPKIENGDFALNQSGEATFLYEAAAAKQIVHGNFYLWNGELYYDKEKGIKWLEIKGKGRTTQEILQFVQSALIKDPYIQKVVDLSINFETLQDRAERRAKLVYTVIMDKRNITGDISP